MKAIEEHPQLKLQVVAAGMHLSPKFGYTVQEIKKDGFRIDARIPMTPESDSLKAMARSIGVGIIGFTDAFQKLKPHLIVVLGDRVEALAVAITASYMNIPVAHIHGGDSARAGLDEYARHAITKLSHLHFAATQKSADRIKRMGEDPRRVFVVGAPGLDAIRSEIIPSKMAISKKYNLDFKKPVLLVVQHPVTTEANEAASQITETLQAIKDIKEQTILIYPNSDAGGRTMITVIKKFTANLPFLRAYPSIPRADYLGIAKYASAFIGNSSSGIIEMASFKLPAVNIGHRQEGRERTLNVIDAPHDRKKIKDAVKKCLTNRAFQRKVKTVKNPYGDGRAGQHIAAIIARTPLNQKLLEKKITY